MIHLIIACTTCLSFGNVTYVSGGTSLTAGLPAQGFTCSSNELLRITDDKNRCFRYNSASSSAATAVLVSYCPPGETSSYFPSVYILEFPFRFPQPQYLECNVYVTLDNPAIHGGNFGFVPDEGFSGPSLLVKDMDPSLSHLTTKFVNVRAISCTGECVLFLFCSPPPAGRKRREVGLTSVEGIVSN